MDCSTDALLQAARCLDCNIPPGSQGSVRSYLLCQWANKPTCDPDALAFIAAAGITDPTQISAICKLVLDLKTTGTPTSFWDRDVIIYPMVGGTAARHALNLKDRTGAFDLLYVGANLVHNQFGITGGGAAGASYANTQFNPTTQPQDFIRYMWYTHVAATVDDTTIFGCANAGLAVRANRLTGANRPWKMVLNNFFGEAVPWVAGVGLGISFAQRQVAGTQRSAIATSLAWTDSAIATTGRPNQAIALFAYVNAGVPSAYSNVTLSGWSVGAPLTTGAEMLAYKAIWDTYENTLGRGHPLGV